MPSTIANCTDSGRTALESVQNARQITNFTIIFPTDRGRPPREAPKGHTDELLREQHPERHGASWCDAIYDALL